MGDRDYCIIFFTLRVRRLGHAQPKVMRNSMEAAGSLCNRSWTSMNSLVRCSPAQPKKIDLYHNNRTFILICQGGFRRGRIWTTLAQVGLTPKTCCRPQMFRVASHRRGRSLGNSFCVGGFIFVRRRDAGFCPQKSRSAEQSLFDDPGRGATPCGPFRLRPGCKQSTIEAPHGACTR